MLETWLRKRRQANSCIQPPPTPTKGSISASVTTKKKTKKKPHRFHRKEDNPFCAKFWLRKIAEGRNWFGHITLPSQL